MGEGGVVRCGWIVVGVDCVGGQAWKMGVGVGGGGLTVAVGCIVVPAIRVRRGCVEGGGHIVRRRLR